MPCLGYLKHVCVLNPGYFSAIFQRRGEKIMKPDQSELIRQIRAIREDRGITYQQIIDSCEMAGESVCKSTVQKIMAAPIESIQCRASTLQAVAHAVIGENLDNINSQRDNVETLRTLLAVREDADRERQQGIADRTAQIGRMQTTIEEQQAEIKRKSRTIKIMIAWAAFVTILLILVAAGLIAYLIWDYVNPQVGMFRK